jgi:hypothetical protein
MDLSLRPCVPRTDTDGAMLRRESLLDQEVLTWLARLEAAMVPEKLPAGDDCAKCVGKAASPAAVAIHECVRAGVQGAAETTGRGGASPLPMLTPAGLGRTNGQKADVRFDSSRTDAFVRLGQADIRPPGGPPARIEPRPSVRKVERVAYHILNLKSASLAPYLISQAINCRHFAATISCRLQRTRLVATPQRGAHPFAASRAIRRPRYCSSLGLQAVILTDGPFTIEAPPHVNQRVDAGDPDYAIRVEYREPSRRPSGPRRRRR